MATKNTNINSSKPNNSLNDFKKLVRKAIFLEHDEEVLFNKIPDEKWQSIFETNFLGNFAYAKRVLLNESKAIDNIDNIRVEKEKKKIHNLAKATDKITSFIDKKDQIVFITDFDNDGSLAQAIINEYLAIDEKAALNMQVHYAQVLNGNPNRGFTVDLIDKLVDNKKINPEKPFLIITADNGINSRDEQVKIQNKYPNAQLVVTDHHNPESDMVILEDDKSIIFNPHYKPTPFFQENNISGATTIGVLLKNVLEKRFTSEELPKRHMDNIQKLSKVSNLLDYVKTDPVDKPEKSYIISKFLELQPLLNINNSISKIITGEIKAETIQAIKDKIPQLNTELLYEEAKNIHNQNKMAQILLKIYNDNNIKELEKEDVNIETKLQDEENDDEINSVKRKDAELVDFTIVKELNNLNNYLDYQDINPNYIEQLRPIIFGLSADDEKNIFMSTLNERMIELYKNIQSSEKRMAQELRKGEVITKTRLKNSCIAFADPNILTVFNRKFLNKVYNDENPGFTLTLDHVGKSKVAGSFRSLYDISDILKHKKTLEKMLKVKIETPGHERAAGFIMTSLNPEKNPITKEMIEQLNEFIDNSIQNIKIKEKKKDETYLLTDLSSIKLIDRINQVVLGNVAHFDRILPLLKITPDTIWTDSYTTQQYTMQEIINERKYGYITININFNKDTVIVPVELIRRIVENNYEDYLSLNYLDGGVFMTERIIEGKNLKPENILDVTQKNKKSEEIIKVFEKDFKDKNYVNLNRAQIKDNPFFKYHDYGDLNFDLFEKMVIGILDSNQIDLLAVFDVEANGFANAKLMNLGSMNYSINPTSGEDIDLVLFESNFFSTIRGDEYLLTEEEQKELTLISKEDFNDLSNNMKKLILTKVRDSEDSENGVIIDYYIHPVMKDLAEKDKNTLPFKSIKNYLVDTTTETVKVNREIQATMLAFLVKEDDFKVPQQMTTLTGITQDILNKYGKPTSVVDDEFSEFYKGKTVLFGAHNTPYDARVLRANTPKIYQTLENNFIYDSALFSKEDKLAYDDVKVTSINGIVGFPKNIYFYNNKFSDYNLVNFIERNKNGYYPDRTNKYLLGIEDGKYLFVDKEAHEIIKLDTDKEKLLSSLKEASVPGNSVKYGVESLSQQWMIHALLLSDEKFNIKKVDFSLKENAEFKKYEKFLDILQSNYHFDSSPYTNLELFSKYCSQHNITMDLKYEQLLQFTENFLTLNKEIQQKFSDAWIYKSVLSIKEPEKREDVTNDLVDLVRFQTAIPKKKIKKVFSDALEFKKKYGISHIIQHESHVNGPWEGDMKGDIAFEDKLTLSLLAQRYYDPYNHNISLAIEKFNQFALKARFSFEKTETLSANMAYDSYSFRQALLYERDNKTKLIEKIQKKEAEVGDNKKENIILLKLDNDILNPGSFVQAVVKKDITLSRENIVEDSKKLSFVLANEQLVNSITVGDIDSESRELLKPILEGNYEKCVQIKKELSEHYRFISFEKLNEQTTKFLDLVWGMLFSEGDKGKKARNSDKINLDKFTDMGRFEFELARNVLNSCIESANKNVSTEIKPDRLELVKKTMQEMEKQVTERNTPLEMVLKDETAQFVHTRELRTLQENNETEDEINDDIIEKFEIKSVSDIHFLPIVNINRQNPVKHLVSKFNNLRLLNNFIEYNIETFKEDEKFKNDKKNKKIKK